MKLPDGITEEDIKEAIKVANNLNKMSFDCPRFIINPGLFFGFILGVLYKKKKEIQ